MIVDFQLHFTPHALRPKDLGRRLQAGVELDDGVATADRFRVVDRSGNRTLVEITLHEGRKHIVRRMLDHVGHPVSRLIRTRVGPVGLGDLKPGRWRHLTRTEIARIFRLRPLVIAGTLLFLTVIAPSIRELVANMLLLSTSMIICNYVDAQWLVVLIMAFAFFGKGIGALGWAVVSDTCPREIAGLSGGLFNMFGNISSITTPIVIGYIIQTTGSFNGALVFVGANALIAAFSYLVIVGEIKRLVLRKAG